MKRVVTVGMVAAVLLVVTGTAFGQCMLANPSFEIPGSSGAAFGGWSQFGPVAALDEGVHGNRAAYVTGPNTGNWDVAGVWQKLPCTPGQRWTVGACVTPSEFWPLSGGSRAILNVEWRDSGDNLISYDSFTAADAGSPPGAAQVRTFQTSAAPPGTASIRYLLGVLQGPGDATPRVLFDLASCEPLAPTPIEGLQWNDFPSGRTVAFAGRTWRVKGTGYYGPGPNLFDSGAAAASVDVDGRLHLTIHKVGNSWYSSEVALDQPLGYGDYVFTTRGRLDLLDRNTVLGMFLWQYGACYNDAFLWWNPFNEIDIEFSRWGQAGSPVAQFAAQPANIWGNTHRFDMTFITDEIVSHAMRWLPDRVEYRIWRGGPGDESPATTVGAWTYMGDQLPRPDIPRVHLNLWQLSAPAVTQEVVFDNFTFRPACPTGDCRVLDVPAPQADARGTLAPPAPNPVAERTTLRWRMAAAGPADLSIFDLAGRRVRRLASGAHASGDHTASWNAHDEQGLRVPAGMYLVRLRANGVVETRRILVLE